ncbi:MAG TPA: hypothetical protein VK831_07475 [Candidatus Deferrimicrobiaceae bacterium]|nr:hypothetical protein [Candidatus Deferrimicrobiaceae bacterium]
MTDASDGPPRSGDGRPALERAGLAVMAAVTAVVFGGLAVAAWSQGELFLAVMSGIGALMTLWAATASLLRS